MKLIVMFLLFFSSAAFADGNAKILLGGELRLSILSNICQKCGASFARKAEEVRQSHPEWVHETKSSQGSLEIIYLESADNGRTGSLHVFQMGETDAREFSLPLSELNQQSAPLTIQRTF